MKIKFDKTYKLNLTWIQVLDNFKKGICPIQFPDEHFMWKCKPFSRLSSKCVYKFIATSFPLKQHFIPLNIILKIIKILKK